MAKVINKVGCVYAWGKGEVLGKVPIFNLWCAGDGAFNDLDDHNILLRYTWKMCKLSSHILGMIKWCSLLTHGRLFTINVFVNT
jgi:hypothetical protein